MRRLVWAALVVLISGAGGYAALEVWPIDRESSIDSSLTGNADRGAYLARASGCIGCHTNIEGGGKPLAGGPPLRSPFGTYRAPNLTTDTEHGIGAWSLAEFATAVQDGVSPSGEPYYPAFPYQFYASFSDQEIADLYAAFRTVPPVAEPDPEPEIPFPFNLRAGLKLWRVLHPSRPIAPAAPDTETAFRRGQFLVEGPAHCGACHTPRNLLGGLDWGKAYAGSVDLSGSGRVPPLRSDELQRKGWDISSLAFGLRSGVTPKGDVMGGAMGEIVRDSTSFLSDEDLAAIATYLINKD